MPHYVLLTKLSPVSFGDTQHRESFGRDWFETVKEKCPEVLWIDHYALLGQYDFMDIYEAPDNETAAKVAIITMSKGAVKAETIPALPYKRYLDLVNSI